MRRSNRRRDHVERLTRGRASSIGIPSATRQLQDFRRRTRAQSGRRRRSAAADTLQHGCEGTVGYPRAGCARSERSRPLHPEYVDASARPRNGPGQPGYRRGAASNGGERRGGGRGIAGGAPAQRTPGDSADQSKPAAVTSSPGLAAPETTRQEGAANFEKGSIRVPSGGSGRAARSCWSVKVRCPAVRGDNDRRVATASLAGMMARPARAAPRTR